MRKTRVRTHESQVRLPALDVTNADRIAFHMAEFNFIKSEIAELVKQTNTSMTFAITTSAGIAAWLFAHPAAYWWARYLPLGVSLLFGCQALSYYMRIGEKGEYLLKIEQKLGSDGLGWEEEFRSKPKLIGAMHTLSWGALNMAGAAVALFLPTK